jgi:hypothetical protein
LCPLDLSDQSSCCRFILDFLIVDVQSKLYQIGSGCDINVWPCLLIQSDTSSSTSGASPIATACSNCTVTEDEITGHLWVQGVLNYTPATVVTIVDYDTNSTSTTLVPNNAPFSIGFENGQNTQYYGAEITGTVFTTEIFGTSLELTYPTPYLFIMEVNVSSATQNGSSCETTAFPTSMQIIYAVTAPASWTTNYLGSLDTVPLRLLRPSQAFPLAVRELPLEFPPLRLP